jgi:hypothetical protein
LKNIIVLILREDFLDVDFEEEIIFSVLTKFPKKFNLLKAKMK